MDHETGLFLKSLLDDPEHDTYIKSVHSKDVDKIMEEGIRCLGNSSSVSTTNPTAVSDISLEHTVTKVDDLTILVELAKKHNGFSQGFNAIDGTMILMVPKGTDKNDMLYYNENTQTFNINPNYIVGFLPVDENHNVKNFVLNNKDISSNKAI